MKLSDLRLLVSFVALLLPQAGCSTSSRRFPASKQTSQLPPAQFLEFEDDITGDSEFLLETYTSLSTFKITGLVMMGIAIPPRGGLLVRDPACLSRSRRELGSRLGGWFDDGLDPFITVHEGFWNVDDRRRYAYQVGPSASELTRRVHRVALHTPPWNVIGIGIPGWFHSVTIYRFLSAREAVGPDGAPVASPLGLVESVLGKATPQLNLARLRDRTQADFARGYSFYRTDAHTSVRARVGRRCDVQNQRTVGCGDYYFGIRINFWYDGCTNRFCPREP